MIQSLGRRYVQYINKKYARTGTLWEGRFKSSLVSIDEYLLTCSCYIELNPVRAHIVEHPKDYIWSSYGFKAEGRQDELLDIDPVYAGLGQNQKERQINYSRMFIKSVGEKELSEIRNSAQKGIIFGNQDFSKKITKLLGKDIIHRPRGRPKK